MAEKKLSALEHLELLALRAAKYSNKKIAELNTAMIAALKEVQTEEITSDELGALWK